MAKAPVTDTPKDSTGETPEGDTTEATANVADPTPASPAPVGLKLGGAFKLKVPTQGAGSQTITPVAPAPGPDATGSDSNAGVVEESQSTAAIENPTSVPQAISGGLTLAGLASLETPSVGIPGLETMDIDPSESGGYLDEVPATAPVRDLPTELDKQQKAFIDSLDSIYRLHDDPEMFTNMVRKIMSEMQARPELCELLAASKGQDSNAIIRGLRQSAGMAQVKKQESKAKRSGKAAKPQSEAVDSVMASLQGLAGFDGGFD